MCVLAVAGRLRYRHCELKARLPREAKVRKHNLGIVHRINRVGWRAFWLFRTKRSRHWIYGTPCHNQDETKATQGTETHGTNIQRSPSSFEWLWLTDITPSILIVPFCNVHWMSHTKVHRKVCCPWSQWKREYELRTGKLSVMPNDCNGKILLESLCLEIFAHSNDIDKKGPSYGYGMDWSTSMNRRRV